MAMPQKITTSLDVYLKDRMQISNSGCWEWQLAKSPAGYGYTAVANPYKTNKAHRLSYSVFNGPIPKGLLVRHTCDNPTCINPKHLLVGTDADNVLDKVTRGRQAKGAAIRASTLTESDVYAIRAKAANGVMGKDLAIEYQISGAAISEIINRKSWTHI
jgi:hypothetical protein